MHAGKTRSRFLRDGLERPRGRFGQESKANNGVAPAQFGVLPAPKFFVVHCATLGLHVLGVSAEVTPTVTDTVIRLFYAPVTVLSMYGKNGVLSWNYISVKKDALLRLPL